MLRGPIKGAVSVNGGRVTIDGPVAGDVESNTGHLRPGPNARIGGTLHYRSGEDLERDPAAQVSGTVERLPVPLRDDEGELRLGAGLFWTLGLMALAAALLALLPVSSRSCAFRRGR